MHKQSVAARPRPTRAPEPTEEQFDAYRALFAYFNRTLFNDELPGIVLNFSRHANSLGFFSSGRWKRAKGEGRTHEISLNPDKIGSDPRDDASTLVHEMVHLWQQVHGTPPRPGYHDRQWASKMEQVGLIPSTTGKPGGKRVGQKMDHYIPEDGVFARAFAAMPEGYLLPWRSLELLAATRPKGGGGSDGADDALEPAAKKTDPSKLKYTCPGCAANVWGKPGLNLLCGDCEEPFACAA